MRNWVEHVIRTGDAVEPRLTSESLSSMFGTMTTFPTSRSDMASRDHSKGSSCYAGLGLRIHLILFFLDPYMMFPKD